MHRTAQHTVATVAAAAMSIGLAAVRPAAAFEDETVDLGQPISSVVIADGAYGHGPNGEPWIYVVVKGPPGLFNVIDARTGELVFDQPLERTTMSWGMETGPDDTLWIGSSQPGRLYRYEPGAPEVEDLGAPIDGKGHVYGLHVAEDGRVYAGTFDEGRVFEYDPHTDRVTDFGRMHEREDYVRGTASSQDEVFVATGAQEYLLMRIDRDTGEASEIPLPDDAERSTMRNLTYQDGLLFTSVRADGDYLVYDVDNGQWQRHPHTTPSPPGPDGRLYSKAGHLYAFDPSTGEWENTGFSPNRGSARSYGWLELGESDFPGQTLVSVDMRGQYWLYNPQTGATDEREADVQASPVPIRSTFAGPDGRIYIGGYLSPEHASAYDPHTGEFMEMPGISQVEAFGEHDGKVLIGGYPNARVRLYDPAREWGDDNPEILMELGDEQDRPFAFASTGRHIAVGSVPNAGQLGGALTIYDTETGEHETFRHVVQDQSVISLAYHEPTGLLIGGTSISSGLGVEPTTDQGRLFLWDIEQNEKIWSMGTPVDGQMGVTGLTVADDGLVWGVTGQYVFVFDPDRREVLHVENLFPDEQRSDPGTEWVNGYLNFHDDGYLYGQARGFIFALDPDTFEVETLLRHVSYFTQDESGNIYYRPEGSYLRMLPYDALR